MENRLVIVRGGGVRERLGEGQSKCGYKRTTALMEMFYYLFFFFGVFCLFSCFEFIVFSDDWHLIIFCISFRRAAYWLNVYIISKVTPPHPQYT